MNLGIKDLRIEICQSGQAFLYTVSFLFDFTGRRYMATGSAPSPLQCFDHAMAYLSEVMREVVG